MTQQNESVCFTTSGGRAALQARAGQHVCAFGRLSAFGQRLPNGRCPVAVDGVHEAGTDVELADHCWLQVDGGADWRTRFAVGDIIVFAGTVISYIKAEDAARLEYTLIVDGGTAAVVRQAHE
jgi:hypothetical protein